MATLTERAIIGAMLELLEQRRLDKITVKDIADTCGINRNTFYYHFEDTRAVVKTILRNETERIFSEYTEPDSWQDGFIAAAQFALSNKKIILHLYHSNCRDELEQYLKDIAKEVMVRFVKKATEGHLVSSDDCELVCNFYTCGLCGITMGWIGGGMTEDPKTTIQKLGELLEGNILAALTKEPKGIPEIIR